jgi:hypothetical protein
MFGCHGSPGEHGDPARGYETLAPTPPITDGQPLSRADILLEIAKLPHSEVAMRLGPHRIESRTHYSIKPQSAAAPPKEVTPGFRIDSPIHPYDGGADWESTAVTLEETRFIELDKAGTLSLQNLNDHGTGVEALLDRDYLYVRMRDAPYIRHHPEGDEVERLRALGYESGAALLEAVAPFVYLSTPSETSRLGRAAWQVTLSKQQGRPNHYIPKSAGKMWRAAVAVDSLDGYAIVDRQRGTLLELRLSVSFVAPRSGAPPGTPSAEGEQIQVEAQHELRVVALGDNVAPIAPPAEWSDSPTRSRPMLERQELLNGLLPTRP